VEPIEEYLRKRDTAESALNEVDAIIRQLTQAVDKLKGDAWKSQNWPGRPPISMQQAAKIGSTNPYQISDWPSLQAVTDKVNAYFTAVSEADAALQKVDSHRRPQLPGPPY